MGSTNKTQYLELPQWIGTDKPTFLGDFNDAFLKIDNGYNTISGTATTAGAQAGQAVEDATEALNKAESVEGIANTANTNANQALQTANNAQTAVNQLNEDVSTNASNISQIKNWVEVSVTNNMTQNLTDFDSFCYYNPTLGLLSVAARWKQSAVTTINSNTTLLTLGSTAPAVSSARIIFGGLDVITSGQYTATFADLQYNAQRQLSGTGFTTLAGDRWKIQLMLYVGMWV